MKNAKSMKLKWIGIKNHSYVIKKAGRRSRLFIFVFFRQSFLEISIVFKKVFVYDTCHMEKEIEVFNEKEYLIDMVRIKYLSVLLMKKHHLIDDIVIKNTPENIEPFYGRIGKNGAFVMEFSKGVPSLLHSPFGGYQFEAAKLCRGSLENYKAYWKEMNENFDFKEVEPTVNNNLDLVGPMCVIRKLPWRENEKLPEDFDNNISMTNKYFGSKAEDKHIAALLQEVDEYFIKSGHAEMVYSVPKPKEQLKRYIIEEPKKSKCVILGQLKQFLKGEKEQNKRSVKNKVEEKERN